VDTWVTGPFFIVDFWFKYADATLTDQVVYSNTQFDVLYSGYNKDFKVIRAWDAFELTHPNGNITTGWNHVLVKHMPIAGNPSAYQVDVSDGDALSFIGVPEALLPGQSSHIPHSARAARPNWILVRWLCQGAEGVAVRCERCVVL
jgi:hypothetical protein